MYMYIQILQANSFIFLTFLFFQKTFIKIAMSRQVGVIRPVYLLVSLRVNLFQECVHVSFSVGFFVKHVKADQTRGVD